MGDFVSTLASLLDRSEGRLLTAVESRLRSSGRGIHLRDALRQLVALLRDVSPMPRERVTREEREALHEEIVELLEGSDVGIRAREWRILGEWRRDREPAIRRVRPTFATAAQRRHGSSGPVVSHAIAPELVSTPAPQFDLVSRMATLAEARNEEELLAALARLATPTLADLCIVDLVFGGEVRRVKVAHHDPVFEERAERLLGDASDLPCRQEALALALDGRSQVMTQLGECGTAARAAFEEVEARSMLLVPLRIAAHTVAMVAFVTTAQSGRRYGDEDLVMAEELVGRVAVLIENMRLREQSRVRDEKIRIALEKANVRLFEVAPDLSRQWLIEAMTPDPQKHPGPEFIAAVEAGQREAFRTGERTRVEGHFTVEGEERHIVLTHVPIVEPNGEVTRLIATAVDVTEEIRTREELSRALEFRDQVLGILGHDLRNPLSAILGVVGLARLETDLPERAIANLAQIDLATRRMLEMIGTLLDFSQARFARTLPVVKELTDLREVGAHVAAELRSAHPDRAIEVVTRGDTSGIWDRARLAQVASNLLGNALTHGDSASTVTLFVEDRGDAVDLAVHNRGPMIAAGDRGSLFEPFRRGESDRGGLGLGLFIARQIVRAHGGTIDVESSDAGTTFTAHLPRTESAASA